MITFYKNETDIIFELEPLEGYPYYSKITVGYCKFDNELSPNDLYFEINYRSSNLSGANLKTVRYIIKNANNDNYVTALLLNEFIPEGERLPDSKIFCNIFDYTTHEPIGSVMGAGGVPQLISDIPSKLYLHRITNKTNVFSNNTLYKYGILVTFNRIVTSINCSVVNDDIPYINIMHTKEDETYRNDRVYGVLENTPKDKEFVGFTFSPYSKKVDIKLGETIINDYVYNLYPVYDYIKTPTEEDKIPEITLYKNSAEKIAVDKTNYLIEVAKTVLTFRDECDIISPKIVLNRTDLDFNYVYIKSLKRYYFVNNITIINNNLMNVDLTIDILMSYKDGIRNLRPFVSRNEFYYDENITDDKRVIYNGHTTHTTTIETNLFKMKVDEYDNEHNPNSLFINGFNLDIISGD